MDAPRRKKWPLVVGIVAGVLVIAVVIASFVLDSVLTNKAHEQAAQYSQQLGRPITIGSVSTRILTGLGATVKDVSIGPAAGEGLPLAQVKSADVRVGLLRAIFSAGKDVVVRSAEVDGLNVNVIRFDDGTTNLERLQNKLAQTTPKKEEKAPAEQKQSDLSNLRVDHAALREGKRLGVGLRLQDAALAARLVFRRDRPRARAFRGAARAAHAAVKPIAHGDLRERRCPRRLRLLGGISRCTWQRTLRCPVPGARARSGSPPRAGTRPGWGWGSGRRIS